MLGQQNNARLQRMPRPRRLDRRDGSRQIEVNNRGIWQLPDWWSAIRRPNTNNCFRGKNLPVVVAVKAKLAFYRRRSARVLSSTVSQRLEPDRPLASCPTGCAVIARTSQRQSRGILRGIFVRKAPLQRFGSSFVDMNSLG